MNYSEVLIESLNRVQGNKKDQEPLEEFDDHCLGFIEGVISAHEDDTESVDEKALKIQDIIVKNHTKPGTASQAGSKIAKAIMSKYKTLKQAMAAVQFFINRRGTSLTTGNFNRALAAQKIIRDKFSKKTKKK